MSDKPDQKHQKSINIGTILTGGMIGFLAAAVLYRKVLPSWIPIIFSEKPITFFAVFIIVCGFFGYLWTLTDDD